MSSRKLNYNSIGKAIDGANYCAGVETLAENVIEDTEESAVVEFPSHKTFASLRSSTYRIDTNSLEIALPYEIYKIVNFFVKAKISSIEKSVIIDEEKNKEGYVNIPLSEFKNSKGQSLEEFDIAKALVTEEEWNALPGYSGIKHDILAQDTALIYKIGERRIVVSGDVYNKSWVIFEDETTKQMRVLDYISSIYFSQMEKDPYKHPTYKTILGEPAAIYTSDIPSIFRVKDLEWKCRIVYVPISTKTKIRARKTAKQDIEYLQPFNQRAEVNAASAFGKNMWLTAQKTGTEQITVVKNYTKLKDIPPVGALVKHNGKKYRLVSNSYQQTNTIYIQVTHTLSENWTSKSKHVAVNQKYRNYNIPQDILLRNMYWEDYITVSSVGKTVAEDTTTGKILDKAIQLFYVPSINESNPLLNDSTIDTFAWKFEEKQVGNFIEQGVLVPCATIGIANSIVFFANFKDNFSAGLRMNYTQDEEGLLEEAVYCNEDGTLESATVIFSDGFNEKTDTDTARKLYPSIITNKETGIVYNAPNAPIFEKKFYVDKDAGEAIKFTYQVHFVTEGDCVVGNKVAEHNPLIKRYEKSSTARQFKVWLLKNHIREGEDLIVPTDNDLALSQTANGDCFTVWHPQGGNNARISLKDEVKAKLVDYKAWAITDENNHLYVGRNENQEGIVHLCISHKRN